MARDLPPAARLLGALPGLAGRVLHALADIRLGAVPPAPLSRIAISALVCALLFGDSVPIVKVKPRTPVQARFNEGVASLEKGDLNRAEEAFRDSRRLDSAFVPAIAGLAAVLVKQGKVDEAAVNIREALARAPKNFSVQWVWARCLAAQKKMAEAESAYRSAAALAPPADFFVEFGDFYLLALRNSRLAAGQYRAALALDPQKAAARQGLETALAATGNMQQAQAEFRQVSGSGADQSVSSYILGLQYLDQGQTSKALEAFTEALRLHGSHVPAYLARGDLYASRGDDRRALADYAAVVRLSPRNPLPHVRAGMVYQRANRLDLAEQEYLAATRADSRQAQAYNNLAWMAAERRTRLDEALAWARKAVALEPGNPQFHDTLGWTHRARGELDAAISVLQHASILKPRQPEILYHLGVVYGEHGRTREMAAAMKEALSLSQNFPGAEDARRRVPVR